MGPDGRARFSYRTPPNPHRTCLTASNSPGLTCCALSSRGGLVALAERFRSTPGEIPINLVRPIMSQEPSCSSRSPWNWEDPLRSSWRSAQPGRVSHPLGDPRAAPGDEEWRLVWNGVADGTATRVGDSPRVGGGDRARGRALSASGAPPDPGESRRADGRG